MVIDSKRHVEGRHFRRVPTLGEKNHVAPKNAKSFYISIFDGYSEQSAFNLTLSRNSR